MDKIINIIKRLFCKHEYAWFQKIEPYHILSGERFYYACLKCGKVKEDMFIKYE